METKAEVLEKALASNWTEEPLSELVEYATGGAWGELPETADGKTSIVAACIRGTDFRDWETRKARAAVSRAIEAKSFEKRRLKAGDILLEVSGGGPEQPVGRTILIDDEAIETAEGRPMVPTNFLRLLRLRAGVDAAFVNYYMKFFYATGNISDYQGGSNNLRNLRFKDYLTIEIPLAPLPEQRRIVQAIETQLGRLDAAVARLQAAKAQLKRYKQAVYEAAVKGRMFYPDLERDELPEGWEVKSLGELIEAPRYGTSKKCDTEATGTPVLRIPNIGDGKVDHDELKYAVFDKKERTTYEIKAGDLLTIRSNGSVDLVGKCALITEADEHCLYAGYLIRLRPKPQVVDSKYLLYHLSSLASRSEIESKAKSTSGVNNINAQELKDLTITLPPLKEQVAIGEAVEEFLDGIAALDSTLDAQLEQSTRLRQAVLKRAFEGRLVTTSN